MDDTGPTARALALLSLLQARPHWPGPELAERLGVTARTVRRDVERLRRLGYPVVADSGTFGGYRLAGGGRAMPPLMLDRDEAVAVAVCLRSAATGSVTGGGEAAVRALGKLETMLPATLRRHVGAIGAVTTSLGPHGAPVDPDLLVTISRACRDGERVRARYRDGHGRETDRTIDPYRLVSTARRWYLVARDRDRDGWRTFRVDRLAAVEPTGHVVTITDPPDPVALVQSSITTAPYRHRARVVLHTPLADARALVPPTVGALEAVDERTTILTTGADRLDVLTLHLVGLGVDFDVIEPEALRRHVAATAERLASAARGPAARDGAVVEG